MDLSTILDVALRVDAEHYSEWKIRHASKAANAAKAVRATCTVRHFSVILGDSDLPHVDVSPRTRQRRERPRTIFHYFPRLFLVLNCFCPIMGVFIREGALVHRAVEDNSLLGRQHECGDVKETEGDAHPKAESIYDLISR